MTDGHAYTYSTEKQKKKNYCGLIDRETKRKVEKKLNFFLLPLVHMLSITHLTSIQIKIIRTLIHSHLNHLKKTHHS